MENRKMILVFIAGALIAAIIVILAPKIFNPGKSSRDVESNLVETTQAPPQDFTQTIAEAKVRLAANPNDIGTLVELGNLNYDAFQAVGTTSYCTESIRFYERALALKPGDPNVLTDLGYMYRSNGEPQKAVERFKKAMAASSTHPQSRMNLGITLYYDLKDLKGAKTAFTDYLKIDPDSKNAESVRQILAEIAKGEAGGKAPPK